MDSFHTPLHSVQDEIEINRFHTPDLLEETSPQKLIFRVDSPVKITEGRAMSAAKFGMVRKFDLFFIILHKNRFQSPAIQSPSSTRHPDNFLYHLMWIFSENHPQFSSSRSCHCKRISGLFY